MPYCFHHSYIESFFLSLLPSVLDLRLVRSSSEVPFAVKPVRSVLASHCSRYRIWDLILWGSSQSLFRATVFDSRVLLNAVAFFISQGLGRAAICHPCQLEALDQCPYPLHITLMLKAQYRDVRIEPLQW